VIGLQLGLEGGDILTAEEAHAGLHQRGDGVVRERGQNRLRPGPLRRDSGGAVLGG
jgi:hypothetical protein